MRPAALLATVLLCACGAIPRDRSDGGGPDEAGACDAGPCDAGPADTGGADAGPGDAGSRADAGPDLGPENTNARCADGISNDGDRYVDCDDYDCTRSAAVTVCGSRPDGGGLGQVGHEDTDALCSDGESNDGDGYVDCDDYDCSESERVTVCFQRCLDCVGEAEAPGGACGTQAAACDAQAACKAIRTCVAGCPDDACDLACQDAHPDGWTLYDAMMNCVFEACRRDC